MFPEPPLPHAAFSPLIARSREVLPWKPRCTIACDVLLDNRPAQRKIIIVLRKPPDCMQVIGHQHPCNNLKRHFQTHLVDSVTQRIAAAWVSQKRLTMVCDDGEKIGGTRNVGASVFWHVGILARSAWCASAPYKLYSN